MTGSEVFDRQADPLTDSFKSDVIREVDNGIQDNGNRQSSTCERGFK